MEGGRAEEEIQEDGASLAEEMMSMTGSTKLKYIIMVQVPPYKKLNKGEEMPQEGGVLTEEEVGQINRNVGTAV